MEFIIYNLQELKTVVPLLLEQAAGCKKWCFYGEVGAGKTTLIKDIGACLGVEDVITSPTYSLINEYEYIDKETQLLAHIYHLDLYRLNNIEEALNIGIEDYLASEDYCLMEWPELIESMLPESVVKISIEIVKDSIRKIVLL